jgi:acetyl esterase
VGQSAGGAHLASAIFLGLTDSVDPKQGPLLKGAILLSATLSYDLSLERRRKNLSAYTGTDNEAEILEKSSVGLFRKLDKGKKLPCEILLMLGEYDFDEIVDANLEFVQEYRKKFGRLPLLEVMKGQNHISYALGVGLDADRLGPRILEFVKHVV